MENWLIKLEEKIYLAMEKYKAPNLDWKYPRDIEKEIADKDRPICVSYPSCANAFHGGNERERKSYDNYEFLY